MKTFRKKTLKREEVFPVSSWKIKKTELHLEHKKHFHPILFHLVYNGNLEISSFFSEKTELTELTVGLN